MVRPADLPIHSTKKEFSMANEKTTKKPAPAPAEEPITADETDFVIVEE